MLNSSVDGRYFVQSVRGLSGQQDVIITLSCMNVVVVIDFHHIKFTGYNLQVYRKQSLN